MMSVIIASSFFAFVRFAFSFILWHSCLYVKGALWTGEGYTLGTAKTIKQVADNLGVTKQAVQKRLIREPLLSRLSPYISTENGTKYISEEGEAIIREAFGGGDAGIDGGMSGGDKGTPMDRLIDTLQNQLAEKDKTIDRFSD